MPDSNGSVTATVADGIATVSFFHPKGNSLPAHVLKRLAEAITEVGKNDDARVVVLRSEGSGPFCAGASFDELAAIETHRMGIDFFMGFARLILAMRSCPKFIVTRVQGKVAGGGVGMVAASDFAVAMDTSSVKLSELAIGIGPFVVGPVIERKIGLGAFTTLAVDADFFSAQWALQHGLYAKVAETVAELDSLVGTIVKKLHTANPEAMAMMKQIFWQGTEHWDTLLPERAAMSGQLVLSDFTRNAIIRFKAK